MGMGRHDIHGRLLANTGRELRARPITIVMYHLVSDAPGPYAITPGSFRRQMELIAGEYRVVRLREVARELEAAPAGERRIVVTFDDAFRDYFETAFPILEQLGVASTVFVPTRFIGGYNDWDAGQPWFPQPLMSADQLRQLHGTGLVDIGSHTVDHARMSGLEPQEMRRQAIDSKAALEDLLGSPVDSFSYPYGQLDDFSDASIRVIAEAGYRVAVTTHWGTRNSARDILRLRRMWFDEADDANRVRRKLTGWYDWIGVKERVGSAMRRVRRSMGRRGAARTARSAPTSHPRSPSSEE